MASRKSAKFDAVMEDKWAVRADKRQTAMEVVAQRQAQRLAEEKYLAALKTAAEHAATIEEAQRIDDYEAQRIDALRYRDAEGRIFHKKLPEAPKASIHKAGHFPTQWVEEAMDRAEASDKCITITMERKGVMIVATEAGDKYASHVITWQAMEKSEVNPLPLAIEDVERKLDLLHKIKAVAS